MTTVVHLPVGDMPREFRTLLSNRRSTKQFADVALPLDEVTGALWAAAGTTVGEHRVCPSARATYPVTATLVAGRVDGLAPGAYRYEPVRHVLELVTAGDHRSAIAGSTLDAGWLAGCPTLLLLTADLSAAQLRFADQPSHHGTQFVWLEAGHAAQNVYLWAAARHLGTVLVAGIDDDLAATACAPLLPAGHQLLGVMGIGLQ